MCLCLYLSTLSIGCMNIRWLINVGGVVGVVVEGLAICGLGCSATAQFHLTAQPSSNTTPGAIIYRIPSIIALSAAIPDAGSPDFTEFSSGGAVYTGRQKISCDIILISCNDINYVSYRITQDQSSYKQTNHPYNKTYHIIKHIMKRLPLKHIFTALAVLITIANILPSNRLTFGDCFFCHRPRFSCYNV